MPSAINLFGFGVAAFYFRVIFVLFFFQEPFSLSEIVQGAKNWMVLSEILAESCY